MILIRQNTVLNVLKCNSDGSSVEKKLKIGREEIVVGQVGSCFWKIGEEKSTTDFAGFNQV